MATTPPPLTGDQFDAIRKGREDAAFIAAAREGVPALLAEVARLRDERDTFANRVDTLTEVAKGNKRHVRELYGDLQKALARVAELEQRLGAIANAPVQTDQDGQRVIHFDDLAPALLAGPDGADGTDVIELTWRAQDIELGDDGGAHLMLTTDGRQPARFRLDPDQRRALVDDLGDDVLLPWADRLAEDGFLGDFLSELASATMRRWQYDPEVPDADVLAAVRKVCADWRANLTETDREREIDRAQATAPGHAVDGGDAL